MALRTDYKDDILDLTQNTQRKYRMITNADGTVSFEDVTVYSQVGDSFGAAELNEIANSVNEGGSNMYYDPATDIKYLKGQDGEWVEVGYGGLLNTVIYEDGRTYIPLDYTNYVYNNFTNVKANILEDSIEIPIVTDGQMVPFGTEEIIDLSRHSTLHCLLKVNGIEQTIILDISSVESAYVSVLGWNQGSTRLFRLNVSQEKNITIANVNAYKQTELNNYPIYVKKIWAE